MEFEFIKKGYREGYYCLFDDGRDVEIMLDSVGLGPGCHWRMVKKLQEMGYPARPEDFGYNIELLYYRYRPMELIGHPEKMERLGFFECSKCGCVYEKILFEHLDPCDNCRYFDL